VEYLARTELGRQVETIIEDPDSDIHTVALCDLDVAAVLRRADTAFEERMSAYLDLPITRHGHQLLMGRIAELRPNFSAYDAAYVALCEHLSATLVTGDAGLTEAVRQHLSLNVIGVTGAI
jgi:predicted nucleic acid-binding protein